MTKARGITPRVIIQSATDTVKGVQTMSNRDMCISVINSMEEWQLQSVLELLRAVKSTMDKLEAGALDEAMKQDGKSGMLFDDEVEDDLYCELPHKDK